MHWYHITGLGMLAVLIVRQEMIHMSTAATLTDVENGQSTLESDFATLQATANQLVNDSTLLGNDILQLKTQMNPDFTSLITRQQALHEKLVSLNTALADADTAEVAADPQPAPVDTPPVDTPPADTPPVEEPVTGTPTQDTTEAAQTPDSEAPTETPAS